ncbi:MAG: histidine phosphatase family protein [Lachnospiraceae bacterium]|nr:histidine phosphatase family protein [Lachnospiraceae bacterium]
MRILLIRHAEPDYSVDSLTPKGRLEAELLSRRLVRYDIRDFYVSPLGRAKDTAAYTLDKLSRKAETLPWLREFRGSYLDPETGKRRIVAWDVKPRIWKSFPGVMDIDTWCDTPAFAGGDVREVWKETVDGTDALLARYGCFRDGPVWHMEQNGDFTIALFCHFGISMAILGYLTGVSPMILWHHTLCCPSSVSEVVTEERIKNEVSFRVVKLGDLTHLESAGEKQSTAGLFPEVYTGIDSTDPAVNGTLK